ncbi:MAG TPA: hypothetical protein VNE58_06710 [Casimicrobiaceae bacterium]|nr:hypothetical protein [Casimicrobiaceae bacterium]
MPMIIAGLALLVLLSWHVARTATPAVTIGFALLVATSQVLVLYSQLARP